MTGTELKQVRLASSMTQEAAAAKLGVTQAYLSMVESGTRTVSFRVASRAKNKLHLPATALPLDQPRRGSYDAPWFKGAVGALGYPGFAYLNSRIKVNPARLLLEALDSDDLDSRVTESLPWIPLSYPQLDWEWLTAGAKLRDRQNRLAYVVALGRQAATERRDSELVTELASRLSALERSRLAREDTLCKESMTQAERKWLRTHRSAIAKHWNLLTDLTCEQLDHVFV